MRDGKKTVAERIFYDALEMMRERTSDDPLKVFKRAIDNVKPAVEVKSRRVGGSNYQVPIEVRSEPAHGPVDPLADSERRQARSKRRCGTKLAGRAAGRRREPRRSGQEERRHAPDGGGQQGLRALSLVVEFGRRGVTPWQPRMPPLSN